MKNAFKVITLAVVLLVLLGVVKLNYDHDSRESEPLPTEMQSKPSSIPMPASLIPMHFLSPKYSYAHQNRCEGLTKWIVITTESEMIAPAMIAVLNSTTDWCLLVLGHSRTYLIPPALNRHNLVYISREELLSLPYKIVNITLSSSFTIRNIGYIYSIHRGAKVIMDMDENHVPHALYNSQLNENKQQLYSIPELVKEDGTDNPIWNSLPQMDTEQLWAKLRGINGASGPAIKDTLCNPIIQQYFAVHFASPGDTSSDPKRIAVPRGIVSPYGADDTVHLYEALWALLLPKTLDKYASGVWRAYVAQSLFYLIPDARLTFSEVVLNVQATDPDTESYVNAVKSINAATKTINTVRMLRYLPALFDYFEQALGSVYEILLDNGVIGADDKEYLNAWISDLKSVGYTFPILPSKSKLWTKDVQLCIMFNWGTTEYVVRILLAYYLRYFSSIILYYDGEWPAGMLKPESVTSVQVNTHQGWFQQRALYDCLKRGHNSNQNVLYIPDDIFFNISSVRRYSLSDVWFTDGVHVDFRIPSQVHDDWWWWTGTGLNYYEALKKVQSQLTPKMMKLYEAAGFPAKMSSHAISDSIYISHPLIGDVLESLELIDRVEPNMFCEVAYPVFINTAVPLKHKVPFLECNLWLEDRTNVGRITNCARTRDYVHPLKLRDKFGRDLWRTFMEDIFKIYVLEEVRN